MGNLGGVLSPRDKIDSINIEPLLDHHRRISPLVCRALGKGLPKPVSGWRAVKLLSNAIVIMLLQGVEGPMESET